MFVALSALAIAPRVLGAFERRAEDFGRGACDHALAQSLAREAAREGLAPVVRLDLFDRRALQASQDIGRDQHSLSFNDGTATLSLRECRGQHVVAPARARRRLLSTQPALASRLDEEGEARGAVGAL
jgi:hypothetical protein